MTLKSGKVYSDIGAPSNTYGVDGDIYMRLDGLKTTYRKEGAVWVAVGSSLGAIPEFISGSGVPSSLLGADDQYYRNVENQDIYYKGGGLWSAIGNLQGLASQALLIQHGIGKDLGTAPNYIDGGDLDAYITQGEFFASSSTLNRPFNQGGPIKVWRFDELEVYQQGQGNSFDEGFATRASSDGGAIWSDWRYYALAQGSVGQTFRVANAVANEDALPKLQAEIMISNALALPMAPKGLGRFKNISPSTVQYYNTFNINTITRITAGWAVTFINPLPSADYIVVGNVYQGGGGLVGRSFEPYNQTTTGFLIQSAWGGDTASGHSTADGAEVNFAVY